MNTAISIVSLAPQNDAPAWWEDVGNVGALLEWLDAECEIDTRDVRAIRRLYEKPWNYSDEWRRMHGEVAAEEEP